MSRTTSPPRKPATWTPSSTTAWRRRCRPCRRRPAHGDGLTEEAGRAHRLHGGFGHRRAADDRGQPRGLPAARRARISPFFVPASIINMISGHISIRYGFTGPNLAIVTACTTGLHCIGDGGRLIEYGDADVMVAGGAESTVSPLGMGGFAAARALSTRNDDPRPRRAPGTRTATASCWARAPACWCSRSTNMPCGAAPGSMPNWSASAWAPTPTT
jgi:hypothetical protein